MTSTNNSAYNPEVMRKRFWNLTAQKEAIVAAAKPHRDEYEKLRRAEQAIEAEQKPVIAKFKEIEAPLAAIDTERAVLARALKGKTGERPA